MTCMVKLFYRLKEIKSKCYIQEFMMNFRAILNFLPRKMIKIGEKYSFMKAYFKIFVIFYLVNHVNAYHMGFNEPAVARGIMAAYKPISKGVNYLKSAMNTLIPKKPTPVDNKDIAPQPAAVPAQSQPLATNPLAPKVSPKNYNPIKAGKNFLKAAINSIMPKKHVPVINPVPSPRPVDVPIPQPIVVPKQTPVPNPYPDPVPVVDPDNSRIVQPYEVPVNVDVPVPQPYDNPIPVDKPTPVANPIPRGVPNPVPVDVPVPIPKNVPTPVKTPMEIPVPYPKIKIIPKPISVAGLAKKIPFLKPFFKDKKPKKSPEETTPPPTTMDPDSQSATKKSPESGAKQQPESPETPAPDNPKEVGFDTPKPPFSFNFKNPFKNRPSKKSPKEPSPAPEPDSEEPPQKYGPPGRTGEDTPSPREAEKSSPQPSPDAPDQQEPDLPNIPEDQGPNGPVSGLGLPPMQLDKNVPKRTPGQGEKILEPKAGDKAPTGPNSKQTGALLKTDAKKEGDLQGGKQGEEEKAQEGKPDKGLLPKWLNKMFKWPFSEIPSNYPSKYPTSTKKDPKDSYSTVPAKKKPTDDLKEYIDSIPIVPSQKPLKEKPSTFDKFSGEPAEKDLVLDTTFPELDDKSRDLSSVKDNKKKRKSEKVKKPGKRKQNIDRKKRSRDLKKKLPLIYDQEFLETSPKIPKKYETALFSDKNILRISKDCLLLCDKKRRSESSSSSTESSTISISSIDDDNMKLSDSESEMTTGRKRKRLIRIENRCVCPPKKDCVKMIKKVNVKQSNNKKF